MNSHKFSLTKKILLWVFLSFSCLIYAQEWNQKNDFPSLFSSEVNNSAFTINNEAYVITPFAARLYKYNQADDSWDFKTIDWMVGQGHQNGFALVIGDKVYVSAGGVEDPAGNDQVFYEYNPETEIWTRLGDLPGYVNSSSIAKPKFSYNNIGYVLTLGDIVSYDPETDTWTQAISTYPDSGFASSTSYFAINDKFYVGGGRSFSLTPSPRFYEYDPVANSWTQVADYPEATASMESFVINEEAYVGGGGSPSGSQYYKYTPLTNTWSEIPDIGYTATDSFSFTLNGKGYVGGGVDQFNFFRQFWEFTPETTNEAFIPDPNKTYYIDSPHHNLRLAATGESEDPYTTTTTTTGADVEWAFVAKGNGSWHIQRAEGGSTPRLRTDTTLRADMQSTNFSGTFTYYDITTGDIPNSYFLTLPDAPGDHVRLQIDNRDNVNMVEDTRNGTWESFTITEVESTPVNIRIEAEDFDAMLGIRTEASTESGDNVGFINNGDWLRFDDVNLSGITNMDARVATRTAGGTLEVRTGSPTGTLLGTINVGNTGGYQNWTTLNTSISNTSGTQDVYLVFTGGSGFLFNVNWIEFNNSASSNSKDLITVSNITEVLVYPNPVSSTTTIQNATTNSILNIYDISGSTLFTKVISSESEVINLSNLSAGVYYGEVIGESAISVIKVLKK